MPKQRMPFTQGWYKHAAHRLSPHFNLRPQGIAGCVRLLVVHNISLPAGNFNTAYVDDLFMGCLNCDADNSFASLQGLQVSAHFFLRRDGSLLQYVSCNDRAWHAGVSCWEGVEGCNDFSIGIELEGCDDLPYESSQYKQLALLCNDLCCEYGIALENIVGHCDIAPGRKTDPGQSFDWALLHNQIIEIS